MPHYIPNTLKTGGQVLYDKNSITVIFDEMRYSISTGHLNGGLHHNLGVRNQRLTHVIESEQDLPGGSVANYLAQELALVGVPPNFGTGLLTAADFEDACYYCYEEDTTIIEVIVTAGFTKTAYRPGQGYYYIERDGYFYPPGTINLLVFTNKALTDGAMTRALLTLTEAKTVALQDHDIKCIRSGKLATGTATDGIVFTINPEGSLITDTGSFSLFGDGLAKAVIHAMSDIIPLQIAKNE